MLRFVVASALWREWHLGQCISSGYRYEHPTSSFYLVIHSWSIWHLEETPSRCTKDLKKPGSSWRSLQAGLNNASFVVKPRFSQGLWQWQALEQYDTAEGLAHALGQGACRGWSSHGGRPPLTPGPSSPTPSTPSLFTTCGAPGVGTRITCGGSWTGSLTCCHQGSGDTPRTSWCHTRAAASRRVGKKPRRNHAQRLLFAIGGASKVCCYDDSVMRHDHCCSQCPLFGAAIDHAWK